VRVVVTGATGTIGRSLVGALRARGDQVVALTRDEQRGRDVLGDGIEVRGWAQPAQGPPPRDALASAEAVVNLLGEPISQRWSDDVKRQIRESRVRATHELVESLGALSEEERPATLISQSATGYYGPSDDRPLDEESPAGSDFLAGVVVEWEREALAAPPGTRTIVTRTGVVLSPGGGAVGKMLPFFRLGLGGPVAGGRQYVSWIHLDDVVGVILHCLDGRLDGAVNVTAPNPVTNAELSKALGRALGRPAVLPVPAAGLKLLYGEMATIVTTGQRVIPRRLEQDGYAFRHPEVEEALRDVLGPRP
jgi:uncharacterized protein (TIGR01777 family)